MVGKKEGVTLTDVDSLLNLLERRKKISIENAAKELNTTISTIENWVSVLEEEGIVTTKYSLTTPFIELKQNKDGKQAGIFSDDDNVSVSRQETAAEDAEHTEKGADFGDASSGSGQEFISSEDSDIKSMIAYVRSLMDSGDFSNAQKTYDNIKKSYDSLPVVFLKRKNEIETELIHLNNELSVALYKQDVKRVNEAVSTINSLLKNSYELLKNKKVDEAVELYNEIKNTYNSLPEGFYGEKTKLAEDILNFFQKLSLLTREISKLDMEVKSRKILMLVRDIESMIAQRNIERAIDAYSELKDVYSSLPPGYLDQKLDIQEKMINIYRQLMIDKKSWIKQDIDEKLKSIRQMLNYAESYMKNRDIENGVKSFNEAKAIFEHMPAAFSDEYNKAQQLLLDYYRRLMELRKYTSTQIITQGTSRIDSMISRAVSAYNNKDYDVARDIYRQIVDEYNKFPEGFDPVKVELRKRIYKLYYDVVSGSDFVELGELNPYIKTRYLKLLDLLVNAHEVIDSKQFSIIGQVYNNIYSVYNELPIYLVNKNFLLKDEITKVFEIYRLYQAAQSLRKYDQLSDARGVRYALNFINRNFTSAEKNCYGFVRLLEFVKEEYELYAKKALPAFEASKQHKTLAAQEQGAEAVEYSITKPAKNITPDQGIKQSKDVGQGRKAKESDYKDQIKDVAPVPDIKQDMAKEEGSKSELLEEEEERTEIDHLFNLRKTKQLYKAAMKNIGEGDYVTATKALHDLLKLDPRNRDVENKLIEVTRLRERKFKDSVTSRLIAAKKKRIKMHLDNKSYDNALQEIYTVLELDPDDEEAKLYLDKINFEKNKANA